MHLGVQSFKKFSLLLDKTLECLIVFELLNSKHVFQRKAFKNL